MIEYYLIVEDHGTLRTQVAWFPEKPVWPARPDFDDGTSVKHVSGYCLIVFKSLPGYTAFNNFTYCYDRIGLHTYADGTKYIDGEGPEFYEGEFPHDPRPRSRQSAGSSCSTGSLSGRIRSS